MKNRLKEFRDCLADEEDLDQQWHYTVNDWSKARGW